MDYIQLKESSVKIFGIRTADGKDTGEYIEIDIEDLDLPQKAEMCNKKHIENIRELNNKKVIISKKEDHKGTEDICTDNEKEWIKAIKEFYKKEEEAIDLFLGDGATKKFLNGRKPYLSMFEDITEYIEQIVPILKKNQESIIEKVKEKYSNQDEENVI